MSHFPDLPYLVHVLPPYLWFSVRFFKFFSFWDYCPFLYLNKAWPSFSGSFTTSHAFCVNIQISVVLLALTMLLWSNLGLHSLIMCFCCWINSFSVGSLVYLFLCLPPAKLNGLHLGGTFPPKQDKALHYASYSHTDSSEDGAIWGSVFCSRTLWHAASGSKGSNHQLINHSTSWAAPLWCLWWAQKHHNRKYISVKMYYTAFI